MDTVERNKATIAKYIQAWLEEDKMMDGMSLKEYIARSRISRRKKANKRAATPIGWLLKRWRDCQSFLCASSAAGSMPF